MVKTEDDHSPGDDLSAALQEREARAERQINVIRGVAILVAAAMDLTYAAVTAKLTSEFLLECALFLLVFGLYFLVVRRLTSEGRYRPGLKYITVTVDYGLTLLLFLEYRRLDFFAGRGPEGGAAEFTAFLILLNMLSAFRYGRAIVVYSTILGMLEVCILAVEYAQSLALAFYTPIALAGSGVLTYLLSGGLRDLFLRVRRRESLMRFLPREVVKGIDAGEIGLSLGGVKREVTILLADLRDFTHLAEHQDPGEVVATLNDHFTAMASVIWRHGGTIDKFIGDAVLAFFGAPVPQPDHAVRAVRAAQEMQRVLEELNMKRRERHLPGLRMGIALHTGTVLAGNVGSPERMEYTVMGDAVNVAARIEELNKRYGTDVLLSETTQRMAGNEIPVRPLGAASLRGREESVSLFTPVSE